MQEESAAPQSSDPAPATKSGGDDNLIAALSYIGIISIVVLIAKKDSEFAQFHGKQGVALFIVEVVWWVIGFVLAFIPILGWLVLMIGWLVLLAASIIGFVKALGGEKYSLPVVGDFAKKINL